jgi:hypothetical protein
MQSLDLLGTQSLPLAQLQKRHTSLSAYPDNLGKGQTSLIKFLDYLIAGLLLLWAVAVGWMSSFQSRARLRVSRSSIFPVTVEPCGHRFEPWLGSARRRSAAARLCATGRTAREVVDIVLDVERLHAFVLRGVDAGHHLQPHLLGCLAALPKRIDELLPWNRKAALQQKVAV